jgi:tetratricopeptide (TPR) repeat protein
MIQESLIVEVTSSSLQVSTVSKLELAKDLLNKPESMSQIEDAKSALKDVLDQKEKERAPILLALDNIGKMFAPPASVVPRQRLEKQAQYLREKIKTTTEPEVIRYLNFELGSLYTQLSKFPEAREAYNKVIELKSDDEIAQKTKFIIAWNEKNQGNFEEAIKAFEELSKGKTDEKLANFSQYQLADTYKKKGDIEKAVAIFRDIANGKGENSLVSAAGFQTANIYLYDMQNFEKAKEMFYQSKTLFNDSEAEARMEKAVIPDIAGQFRRIGFKRLSEGYEFSSPSKYKEALYNFKQAIKTDPNDGISYSGMALASFWLKDREKALEAARTSVKLMPDNEVVTVNFGYIYISFGLLDEAIMEYKRYIVVNPATSDGYYNLGYADILSGKLDEAASCFEKATKINPKFYYAFNNLGWCLWQFGQYAKAIESFEAAAKIKPDFADALFNLGMIYKTIGKFEDAQIKFSSVVQFNPSYPGAMRYLKETEDAMRTNPAGTMFMQGGQETTRK